MRPPRRGRGCRPSPDERLILQEEQVSVEDRRLAPAHARDRRLPLAGDVGANRCDRRLQT
jgi:hypothetical protein